MLVGRCQCGAELWQDVTFRTHEHRHAGALAAAGELLAVSGARLAQAPETEGGASCLLWPLIGQLQARACFLIGYMLLQLFYFTLLHIVITGKVYIILCYVDWVSSCFCC